MERERFERMKKLAKEIQKHFKNFYLTGGTALMFKHNHREREDLDFFSQKEFSFTRLSEKVRKIFDVQIKNINLIGNLQGIRLDADCDIFLNKIYAGGRRISERKSNPSAQKYLM